MRSLASRDTEGSGVDVIKEDLQVAEDFVVEVLFPGYPDERVGAFVVPQVFSEAFEVQIPPEFLLVPVQVAEGFLLCIEFQGARGAAERQVGLVRLVVLVLKVVDLHRRVVNAGEGAVVGNGELHAQGLGSGQTMQIEGGDQAVADVGETELQFQQLLMVQQRAVGEAIHAPVDFLDFAFLDPALQLVEVGALCKILGGEVTAILLEELEELGVMVTHLSITQGILSFFALSN